MMNPMKALKEYNAFTRKEAKVVYLAQLQARALAYQEAAQIVAADEGAAKGTGKKLNDLVTSAAKALEYIEEYVKN